MMKNDRFIVISMRQGMQGKNKCRGGPTIHQRIRSTDMPSTAASSDSQLFATAWANIRSSREKDWIAKASKVCSRLCKTTRSSCHILGDG